MSKILISYRREDSADVTGRIFDRLVQQFGREAVFKDVDSIPLGINFRKHLDEQVARCDVFLAVIGLDWKGTQDGADKSRLEDPRDFVRIEVESALKRQIPVIPVLVRGAKIPDPEQLPSSMRELSDRNGIVVRPDPDFHHDMDRLISHLREQVVIAVAEVPPMESEEKLLSELRMLMLSFRTVRELKQGLHVLESHLIKNPYSVEARMLQHDMQAAIEKAEKPGVYMSAPDIPAPIERKIFLQPGFIAGLGVVLIVGAVYIFQLMQTIKPLGRVDLNSARPPTLNPKMTQISPGSFMMGGSGEHVGTPIHKVQFTKPFAIAQYETTFDEYDRFAQATSRPLPKDEGWGRGSRPVINVSWEDAKAYAQWLSQQTGKRYRLPTEAEWEFAARSRGQDQMWPGTSDKSQLKDYAVYGTNRTESVGTKKPNSLGLYDMSGNVSEWLEDCSHENYKGAPADGSAWLEESGGDCRRRVIRGGSWNYPPVDMRTSIRIWGVSDFRNHDLGFRLAQDLEP